MLEINGNNPNFFLGTDTRILIYTGKDKWRVLVASDHLIPKTKDLKKILNNIKKIYFKSMDHLGIKPTKPSRFIRIRKN